MWKAQLSVRHVEGTTLKSLFVPIISRYLIYLLDRPRPFFFSVVNSFQGTYAIRIPSSCSHNFFSDCQVRSNFPETRREDNKYILHQEKNDPKTLMVCTSSRYPLSLPDRPRPFSFFSRNMISVCTYFTYIYLLQR